MRKLITNFFIIFLLFLIISGAFTLFSEPFKEEKEISLTQLVKEIAADKVGNIVISDSQLTITLKDGQTLKSRKEKDVDLAKTLLNLGLEEPKLKEVDIKVQESKDSWTWLGPLLFGLLPLLFFLILFWIIFKQVRTGTMKAFDFTRARARIFGVGGAKMKERITFNDVAGLKEAKEELEEIVDFLKNPKKYLKMGARIPRGVLLMGPPGTGKTMLARAVANEANVPFFSIAGSEFIELFVGVGSARTRDLFSTAKKQQPSIVFIDELDAIGRTRGVGVGGSHEEREQTLNQILVEMDGFERETTTIVMAASISSDTPVLIRQNKETKLLPISEVIDAYYKNSEESFEKNVGDLEVLGFERKLGPRVGKNIYFQNSAFKKVRGVFRHKVNEVYEIKYNGGSIKTTGNHSVFVRTIGRGLKPKMVSDLQPGEILVDLPLKVNRTAKALREVRAHKFNSEFNLELKIWQPLFEKFEPVNFAYQYALAHVDEISQAQLGKIVGFSQRTIGKWQHGICRPRVLSRNYYQHKDVLPEKVKVTPELMRLFGYYVAEGYARKEIDFCLNRQEKEEITDIKNLMKKLFNLEPNRVRYITSGAVNIVYQCKPLADFFAHHCGKGAKYKHVPPFLFDAPFGYFREFVRGYLAGDGYFDKKGRGEMTSVSKKLILELNWLFRMHGFKSYIHRFRLKKGRRICNGKPLPETIAWRLGFGKTQNPLNPVDTKEKGPVYRPLIKSVKKFPYNGYVYDFCGCENEAFFAGESPVLAHNSNRPDVLDPALLRPGRFDRRIVLDLPDINDREAILKIHCRGKPLVSDVNLKEVAERTPGFSGADLANLVNEAALLAARRNKNKIYQTELLESIEKVLLGPERKSHILSKDEKRIAAFHEAGHALVSAFLPEAETVRKISIVARGQAAGYTLKMPAEERKIKSKKEFLSEMATLLGGYTAEKLKFKEMTTGAANDLKIASEIARKLVKEYGMSSLGPITYGKKEELIFLGREIGEERNYSEKLAAKIDVEVAKFIQTAQKQSEQILKKNKKLLEKVSQTLIKKETIEKEEFERLIGKKRKRG